MRCELDYNHDVCLAPVDVFGDCTRKNGQHDESGQWVEWECMSRDDGQCAGNITTSVSAGGTCMVYRCSAHWDKHYEWLDRHNRDYPDSDTPPSWFDPTYAGESWNGE